MDSSLKKLAFKIANVRDTPNINREFLMYCLQDIFLAMHRNQVGADVILRLLTQKGLIRLLEFMESDFNTVHLQSEVIRKLAFVVLLKIMSNKIANQSLVCQMLGLLHCDCAPIIVLNGGSSAFCEQIAKYGSIQLINNLKDT